jgi:hypothetical protein
MRKKTTRIGAAIPMLERGGVRASPIMAAPISGNVRIIAGLRPARSPIRPITQLPTGRGTNPTPNVPKAASKLADGVLEGKKARPM